jgi:lipopolysaccharide export system permease protein
VRSPALGLFGRQVIRDVAVHIAIALGASVTLFITIDSVEAVNRALSRATVTDMVKLQLFNVPAVLQQFAVFCALVGATNAIAALLRRGEIVAVLSAGASASLILKPALIAGLVIGLGYAALTEWIAPPARAEVSAARRRLGLPAQSTDTIDTNRAWFRGEDLVYRIGAIEDAKGRVLGGVLILRLSDGRLIERFDVERLRYTEEGWIGETILHRKLEGDDAIVTERIARAPVALREAPEDFVSRIGAPDRLPYGQLVEATRARERFGQPAVQHRIELYRRIAYPFALAIAVVLGAAIALRTGRRPSIARGLGVGALFGFVLWLGDEIGVSLGAAGAIGAGPAAHAMPFLASSLGLLAWAICERRGIRER